MATLTVITSPALHDALDDLFVAFAAYPFRSPLPATCDCCPDLDVSGLAGRPLRSLTSSDLLDVFHLAASHAGDVNDLRHYLPRFLELLATDPRPSLAPRVLADHLRGADVASWPLAERLALRQYCHLAPETFPAAALCVHLLPILAASLGRDGGA